MGVPQIHFVILRPFEFYYYINCLPAFVCIWLSHDLEVEWRTLKEKKSLIPVFGCFD